MSRTRARCSCDTHTHTCTAHVALTKVVCCAFPTLKIGKEIDRKIGQYKDR